MKRIGVKRVILSCFVIFSAVEVFAQTLSFQREVDTIPVVIDGVTLPEPFEGGINFPRPSFADIDADGDLDLFLGDWNGKIHFSRNISANGVVKFKFEPGMMQGLVVTRHAAPTLADIDNDNDLDLFVGEEAGNINFFRNTGTATTPTFTLENMNFAGANVGSQATPNFVDIDADGDLDLFVGESAGDINFYRNVGTVTEPVFGLENANFLGTSFGGQSVFDFGDIDNDGDLDLFVDTSGDNFDPIRVSFYRNNGTATNPAFTLETSSLLGQSFATEAPALADLNEDGKLDLMIADQGGEVWVSINSGTKENFTFSEDLDKLGALYSFIEEGSVTSVALADIDADGDQDLYFGHGGNVYFYRNIGTPMNPMFTDNSNNRIPGEYPTFVDIDNDGDLDLFIGWGDGTLTFFRNTGTLSSEEFTFVDGFFGGIDVGNVAKPAFGDIDADGDFDLFIGNLEGKLSFYRNNGSAESANYELATANFAGIDVGDRSAPFLADIDQDGDYDLFVGRGEEGLDPDGKIFFYRNTGTALSFNFVLETEKFANVDVPGVVYTTPHLTDIDNDGDLDLFFGEHNGGLLFYRNTTNHLPVPLMASPGPNSSFSEGQPISFIGSAADFEDGDLSGAALVWTSSRDGQIGTGESFEVSNLSVGTHLITLTTTDSQGDNGTAQISVTVDEVQLDEFIFRWETNTIPVTVEDRTLLRAFAGGYREQRPALVDLDNDNDLDLLVGEGAGLYYFSNQGTVNNADFVFETQNFAGFDGSLAAPALCDIDDDGDLDLFVGVSDGTISFYRNVGSADFYRFVLASSNFNNIDVGDMAIPAFADIDGDNDLDLFVGETDDNINFYRNVGTKTTPSFSFETERFQSLTVGAPWKPAFADIDNDGDLDFFTGDISSDCSFSIAFYKNSGTRFSASFQLERQQVFLIRTGCGGSVSFGDLDNDSDLPISILFWVKPYLIC